MPRKNSFSIKTSTPAKSSQPPVLRLRVFAGPNGSGKSTIINSIKEYRIDNRPIDFGYYINADDNINADDIAKFQHQHGKWEHAQWLS